MFNASTEQQEIRREVRRLYSMGRRLVGEWCSELPDLTVEKWRTWEKQAGFLEWWCRVFPEHSGVAECDIRALEFEAMKVLMDKMEEGDIKAVQLVLKLRSMLVTTDTNAQDASMDEWFTGPSGGNGWAGPTAEA